MKFHEFIQKAGNGGFPVPNGESGFSHGDPIFVVKKRELLSLLYRVTPNDSETKAEIEEILKEDQFIVRGPDLPDVPHHGNKPTVTVKISKPKDWYDD